MMTPAFLYLAIALFLCAGIWNAASAPTRMNATLALGAAGGGWAILCAVIALGWLGMGRPPFKTFHETFILLTWCMAVVALASGFINRRSWIFSLASACCAGILIWARINPDLEEALLPPALQSPWFVPHVMVYFFGYSLVILGGLSVAAGFALPARQAALFSLGDRLSTGAFAFLGTGLCLGAIWADSAWGTWWGWDPKECWALVTFLTIAAYRHLPMDSRLSRAGATILLAALAIKGFTYLGMHLLPSAELSVHVYSESG